MRIKILCDPHAAELKYCQILQFWCHGTALLTFGHEPCGILASLQMECMGTGCASQRFMALIARY